ncbi:MAG TPA: efflux RND transporter permease subunit, partial [Candidatus Binataceae bacterium]
MISSLMELALRQRVVVILMALVLIGVGLYSFHELDIEAYPDPVQPLVEVLTLPNWLSAEEVEQLVTVPLELGLTGVRDLTEMRSISLFGLSDIRCYFSWESDYYVDRSAVTNRLPFIQLPAGATAGISPENPIGEIYRYVVESPGHNLMRQKEIEDWVLEKQLRTINGVIDVSGFGGLTKEYHVDIDPQKLTHYGVALPALMAALGNANINVGGNYLRVGEQSFDIRGIGFIHSLDDIRNVVLSTHNSTPIRVADVAQVDIGYAPRLGIVGMNNNDDVVTGIVLMRKYGDTLKTLKKVEEKVGEVNSSGILPSGYRVVPYYDRTQLVDLTLHTVFENLGVGMALVFIVLVFFLGNLRAALIAAVNIPLALLGAFTLMNLSGTPANLISLGAVDFGIIIDTTVIVIENIHRNLTAGDVADESSWLAVLKASQEVGEPMLFSTIIFVI